MAVGVALLYSRDIKEANLTVFRDWMWGAKGESRDKKRFLFWLLSDLGATAGTQRGRFAEDSRGPLGWERSLCTQKATEPVQKPRRGVGAGSQLSLPWQRVKAMSMDGLLLGAGTGP